MGQRKTAAAATTTEIQEDTAKIQTFPNNAKVLREKLSTLEIKNVPEEQEPPCLFSINGVDVIPRQAICIIAAQKKSGKSNFAGLLMAASISPNKNPKH